MTAATTKDAEVLESTSLVNVPPPANGALVPFDGVRMRLAPKEARRRFDELQVYVKECLVEGVDHGSLPGTEKKMLFKPGAVKLCQQFGLAWRLTWKEVQKDWVHGFFYFEAEVTIVDRETMVPVGNAIGSCNSREDKYAYRWEWADRCVKNGVDTRGLKTKTAGKKGDTQYRVPNDDPYSLVNTIQKMAFKRAYVAAVIMATGSDGIFSSDLDTFSPETLAVLLGDEDDVRTWKKGNATDKRADLVAGLLERIAAATTDDECYRVGVTVVELERASQINKADSQMVREKIRARREEPAIKATAGKKAEPAKAAAPAEKPAETPPATASAPAAPQEQQTPPAPKSEPKAATRRNAFPVCGDTNDGCTCDRPRGHEGEHHDDKTDATWGGGS